jgi:hypothetical protein
MVSLPSYTEIVALLKKGATLEAQERIMELREKALELQEENLSLRETVARLQRATELDRELTFDGDVYWRGKEQTKDGPFCPRCRDVKGLLVRIHKDGPGWFCCECNLHYGEHGSYSGLV